MTESHKMKHSWNMFAKQEGYSPDRPLAKGLLAKRTVGSPQVYSPTQVSIRLVKGRDIRHVIGSQTRKGFPPGIRPTKAYPKGI